jgi:predicted RNA-binding Zn ribbon-like protein
MVRQSWQFHLGAGALCLDFANTVSWRRSSAPIERLKAFDDLASWARQSRLISGHQERRLRSQAIAHPQRSTRMLVEALSLREAIFVVAAAITELRDPSDAALRTLERWVREAIEHSRLAGRDRSFHWKPLTKDDRMQQVLYAVALSADDLLTSADAERIGQCSGRDCRWLWLDRTRNKSRRWCDMAVCGNRAKAHRHYARRAAMR